jgi:hypothetical protein
LKYEQLELKPTVEHFSYFTLNGKAERDIGIVPLNALLLRPSCSPV